MSRQRRRTLRVPDPSSDSSDTRAKVPPERMLGTPGLVNAHHSGSEALHYRIGKMWLSEPGELGLANSGRG